MKQLKELGNRAEQLVELKLLSEDLKRINTLQKNIHADMTRLAVLMEGCAGDALTILNHRFKEMENQFQNLNFEFKGKSEYFDKLYASVFG